MVISRRKTTENTSAVGKPKVPKSRRIAKKPDFISKTGIKVEESYCRKCMKNKKHTEFYPCVDNGLVDANGLLSVCKDCCSAIFDVFYDQHGSMEKAILQTCRVLNIRYDETAIGFTVGHINTMLQQDKPIERIFGIYKAKLSQSQKGAIGDKNAAEDFTFVEPGYAIVANPLRDDEENARNLIMFWGENLERDDYVWLENELAEWKKTHKCDTKAEETLLKEICYKGLEIRQARRNNRSPGGLVEEYQKLMKTAGVDATKTSIAGSGKAQDLFSSFIKTIEQNEPAEYFEDKQLFKDIDNIDFYYKKYVTRPIKNFITQSRDFNVEQDTEEDDTLWEELDGESESL